MRTKVVVTLAVAALFWGVVTSSSMASADIRVPSKVSADARDRAELNMALQKSWSKVNANGRDKACWMWENHSDYVRSAAVSTFHSMGFSDSDIIAVTRRHFSRVC